MSILELNDVTCSYITEREAMLALESISFSVEEGEFISLLGPSGCGKTTLLSLIAGLLVPTSGQIRIDGQVQPSSEKGANIGYMLQQDYLFPWRTIEDNITIGQKIRGDYSSQSHKRALDWLEQIGLGDKKDDYPNQLSGGMRQRVALVRMLATDPSLLLLDEPFSALDYQTKLKLEDLVFSTLKAAHKTAILVTHDIGEAIAMSDRIILLTPRPGRIHRTFTMPEEITSVLPFEARSHPRFNELFQLIWKEMEHVETNT